jgi:hypothetical protein
VSPATAERKVSELPLDEVKRLARENEIEGRSKKNRKQLEAALKRRGVTAVAGTVEPARPPAPAVEPAPAPAATGPLAEIDAAQLVAELARRGVPVAAEQPAAIPEESSSVSHSRPILGPGSAGEDVRELCALLEAVGYETSTTRGENPFMVLDASVGAAVLQFRQAHDVSEAEDELAMPSENDRRHYVGAQTWEALYRAVESR